MSWGCKTLCGPLVLVMEAAEHLAADDRGRGARLRLRLSAVGRVENERAVRALGVVVRAVFVEDAQQMTLVQHDQVVQALAPQRPDHPHGDRVGVRGVYRGEDGV